MSDRISFLVLDDEFAYPARSRRAMLVLLDHLFAGRDGESDCVTVARVPEWDGKATLRAADWVAAGEGLGCAACCDLRMNGVDHEGRPAFLRQGPSCAGCSV